MNYIIAVFKNGANIAGYRLFNDKNKEIKDVMDVSALESSLRQGSIKLGNAEYSEAKKEIVGTQGALSRYPQIPATTKRSVNSFEPLTILGKTATGEIITVDYRGSVQELPEKMIIHQAKFTGLSNAKLVPKDAPEKEQHLSAIVGTIERKGELPNYTEKVFDCPNNKGQKQKWKVRIIKTGEKYGRSLSLTNDKGNLVEFIDMVCDDRVFPDGQFVARYYLSTLLEGPHPVGLCLQGDVPTWTINGDNYKQIDNWLIGLGLEPCNRKVAFEDDEMEAEKQAVLKEEEQYQYPYMYDKKRNMEYWDSIENEVASALEIIADFGGLSSFKADADGDMSLIKEVTEFITGKLEKEYGANFPYVEGNY